MLTWRFSGWILLFLLSFFAWEDGVAQKSEDLVKVTLHSEVAKIKPGDSAWLVFKVELKQDWHAYWKTAGQTGFPTTVEWSLPDGVTMEEPLFPSPILYQFQELASYVHKNTFHLLSRLNVSPEATFEDGEIPLSAKFSTLICNESNCIPYDTNLAVSLSVSRQTKKSGKTEEMIKLAREALPRSMSEDGKVFASLEDESILLSFSDPSFSGLELSQFYFFPEGDQFSHGEPQAFRKSGENIITVQIPKDSYFEGVSPSIRGLLTHTQFSQGRSVNLLVDRVSYGSARDQIEFSESGETLKVESGFNQLLVMLGLIVVAMSIWLFGKTKTPLNPSKSKKIGLFISFALLVFGLWLGFPQAEPEVVDQIDWTPWSPEKEQALLADGRAVFVDFTARWCMSCQVNKAVYKREVVIEKFKELDIAPLQADWTKRGKVILEALQKFGREGVPLYVYYPARKKGEAISEGIILPEILTRAIVLKVLEEEKPFTEPAGEGFLAILGLAFMGGVILNLMPCVFPVIGLKIMSFVKQAGEDEQKVRIHGLIFTLGVVLSFWILVGILLGLRESIGEDLGWGFQLQEPVFVFALAVFLLIFALSLSGVFEIGMSLTGVGSQFSQKTGYAGSFFSGFLATIVATPCMAPFLGAAVGAALAMPWISALVVFTFIALGLSFPYLLLSIFPKWISRLPKPGEWMNTFKEGMAFPLYATVAWLLWTLNSLI
jgi:DsbC/DsbD-like thiol-disulfide interchange protein/cytochrome c biogenesis protein CcdA